MSKKGTIFSSSLDQRIEMLRRLDETHRVEQLRRLLVGKTQMTCIERFEADKAAILDEWYSGDRVVIKFRT